MIENFQGKVDRMESKQLKAAKILAKIRWGLEGEKDFKTFFKKHLGEKDFKTFFKKHF